MIYFINLRRVGGLSYSSLSVQSVCVSVCPCSVAYLVIFGHHNLYVGKLVALELRGLKFGRFQGRSQTLKRGVSKREASAANFMGHAHFR